ncbi:MAG: aminoacyl-tRNA hydrolase [Eudoraea sp.]|nr:aminoacyl-tRNA hydrolase [Eudoraea sp.]
MKSFFEFIFAKEKQLLEETDSMKKYLLIGLGNIGDEYKDTRHNVGFQVLNKLSEKEKFSFETRKLGDLGSFKIKGRSVLCLKPSTYMNLSGKSVKYWMEKEKIPMENILVITDDLNLPFGTLRLKTKGSDGGHNGLRDIQNSLQTSNYNRLRIGVGSEFNKGRQVGYVLGKWNDEEKSALQERLERASDLIASFVLAGVKITMNEYNNT